MREAAVTSRKSNPLNLLRVRSLYASARLLLADMNINRLRTQKHAYEKIVDEENGEPNPQQHTRSSLLKPSCVIIVLLLSTLGVCSYAHWIFSTSQNITARPRTCEKVSTRREWRTLTMLEKHEYLASVQCLKTQPSKLGLNHTLYDDFPWIHSRIGEYGRV